MSDEPVGSRVIFCDDIIDTVTNESVPDGYFSAEAQANMFNSAPSEELKKKRGLSTHVVHTKMGYDIYFHVGIG